MILILYLNRYDPPYPKEVERNRDGSRDHSGLDRGYGILNVIPEVREVVIGYE